MKPKEATIPHELLEHLLDAEKVKNCFECGICTASCPMTELIPDDYNPRILLEKIYHQPEEALKDQALWLCAWCYRCYRHCPQKVKLPEILLAVRKTAIEQGKLEGFNKALMTVSQTIPFPASFGLVCLHPERAGIIDNRENVEKRLASKGKKTKPSHANMAIHGKVAVIGSGPAGLTAAYELAKKGYAVTVYESNSQPGGMLRQCIPEFRLPKKLLDEEIEHIRDAGVEIKTSVKIGKDQPLDQLWQQEFEAVFISVGAHKTRKLNLEGENLSGVHDALDFLRQVNDHEKVGVGERVAIIGGGNVAIDSARTALRLGAKEVTILYRRSKDEMPANPYEIQEAEHEGIKIQLLVAPKRILGQNGRISAVECLKMKLGEPDETGRKAPQPIEGSEFTVPTDALILAIGEAPDLSFLPRQVELGEGNTIAVEPFTAETSQPGLFAGGDCVSGPATFIEAIIAGKKGADCIDQYLATKKPQKTETVLEQRKQA